MAIGTQTMETRVSESKSDLFVGMIKKEDTAKFASYEELRAKLMKHPSFKQLLRDGEKDLDEALQKLEKENFLGIAKEEETIPEPAPEDKMPKQKKEEFIDHRNRPVEVEITDPVILRQIEKAQFLLEYKKIFKNEEELNKIYKQALSLLKGKNTESEADYLKFAEMGLIAGGEGEVREDLAKQKEIEKGFELKNASLEKEEIEYLEKGKKIATIVECVIAFKASDLLDENITIDPTVPLVDYTQHTDGVMEIRKDKNESSFIGLGIDVTYTGLLGEAFKDNFFKLLGSIKNKEETKIKYFKNHNGQMMKEFSVPKIILFFNMDAVRNLVHLVKNIDDPRVQEQSKNSPLKFDILKQLIHQCRTLADFAKKYDSNLASSYLKVLSSIEELGEKNKDIKKILDEKHEDDVSKHLDFLISEFRRKNK